MQHEQTGVTAADWCQTCEILKSTLTVSDSPTPWGRPVHKLCTAAAEAGRPGGGILQGRETWCLRGPGSGPCSPAGHPEDPAGRSGTGFLVDIRLSPGEGAEEGSWAGCPAPAACWGVGVRSGLAGRRGTEEAAWSDDQRHRDLGDDGRRRGSEDKKKAGRRGIKNRKRKNNKRETCRESMLSNSRAVTCWTAC